jgi:hypothetical protein
LDNPEGKWQTTNRSGGPRDSSRINLSEDYEVRYWSDKFGVSKEELVYAVQGVGSMAKDVEAKLDNIRRTNAGRIRSRPM